MNTVICQTTGEFLIVWPERKFVPAREIEEMYYTHVREGYIFRLTANVKEQAEELDKAGIIVLGRRS